MQDEPRARDPLNERLMKLSRHAVTESLALLRETAHLVKPPYARSSRAAAGTGRDRGPGEQAVTVDQSDRGS